MDLIGKRVVILGGTSGIGLAVAKRVGAERGIVTVASSNRGRIDHDAQASRVVDLGADPDCRPHALRPQEAI